MKQNNKKKNKKETIKDNLIYILIILTTVFGIFTVVWLVDTFVVEKRQIQLSEDDIICRNLLKITKQNDTQRVGFVYPDLMLHIRQIENGWNVGIPEWYEDQAVSSGRGQENVELLRCEIPAKMCMGNSDVGQYCVDIDIRQIVNVTHWSEWYNE